MLSRLFGTADLYLCRTLNTTARWEQSSIYQSSPLFYTVSCIFIGKNLKLECDCIFKFLGYLKTWFYVQIWYLTCIYYNSNLSSEQGGDSTKFQKVDVESNVQTHTNICNQEKQKMLFSDF